MTELDDNHPTPDLLRRFNRGEVRGPLADTIETHLETCAVCCAALGEQTIDPLVCQLRAATKPTATGIPLPPRISGFDHQLPAALRHHPRYRILDLLGRGGMGAVYRAEHLLMARMVALKVLAHTLTDHAEFVARFRQEVRASAQLTHPHIVQAFDAEEFKGVHFLVMECVTGTNLASLVAAQGPLPVAAACTYIRQAALGLQYALERGITHRDVKPHNLMLAEGGTVKILDFGLARLVREVADSTPAETGEGMLMGTVDYMAPEQADDPRGADTRSDIYALGCTLHHLLTGQPPFPDGSVVQRLRAHAEQQPPPLLKLCPTAPPALAVVLDTMLAKVPAQRYQTPAEVAAALTSFARDWQTAPTAIVPARYPSNAESLKPLSLSVARPGKTRRPSWVGLLFALGLFLAFLGVGAVFTREQWLIPTVDLPPEKQPSRNGTTLVPLTGDLIVQVWPADETEKHRRGLKIGVDFDALPVRTKDQVRLEARLNQEAYIYLVWLDSEGETTPLYPWNAGANIVVKTLDAPPVLPPQSLVFSPHLPPGKVPLNKVPAWPVEGKAGLETILLLARRTPLPDNVALAELIGKQPPAPYANLREWALLRSAVDKQGANRGPAKEAVLVDEPVLALMSRLRKYFEVVQAMRFAHEDAK